MLAPGIFFCLRVRTTNPLNGAGFGSRFARAGERKRHREDARIMTLREMMLAKLTPADLVPGRVVLRRLSSSARGLDKHDGLPASLKSIVDGIADALGVDDGGPLVEWECQNKRCARGHFGIEITIERRSP